MQVKRWKTPATDMRLRAMARVACSGEMPPHEFLRGIRGLSEEERTKLDALIKAEFTARFERDK